MRFSVAFLFARGSIRAHAWSKDATSGSTFQAPASRRRSHRQHDLAGMLGALDPLMRLRDLGEGKDGIDDRPAASRFQEWPDPGPQGLGIAAFSAGERGRRGEPVWVRRFTMIGLRSTVAFWPFRNAICTIRPSGAAAA